MRTSGNRDQLAGDDRSANRTVRDRSAVHIVDRGGVVDVKVAGHHVTVAALEDESPAPTNFREFIASRKDARGAVVREIFDGIAGAGHAGVELDTYPGRHADRVRH